MCVLTLNGLKNLTVKTENQVLDLSNVHYDLFPIRNYFFWIPLQNPTSGDVEVYRITISTNGIIRVYPYTTVTMMANLQVSMFYMSAFSIS